MAWAAGLMSFTLLLTPGLTWANEPSEGPPTPEVVAVEQTPAANDEVKQTPAAHDESPAPSEPPEPSPEGSTQPSSQPTIGETIKAAQKALGSLQDESDAGGIMPMAVGVADGADPPYVHWNVKDTAGNPVGGMSFKMRYRSSQYASWTEGTEVVTDCVAASANDCTGYDKDPDPGEFLVKQIRRSNQTHNVTAGNHYAAQRASAAPNGYTWVTSSDWVGSSTWQGIGNNRTMNLGTWQLREIVPGQYLPTCQAGYIYGIGETGQLQQIAPNGSKTDIGTKASDVSSFNGLGIGSGGEPVFAYERTNSAQTATIWKFDTDTGKWSSTGVEQKSSDSDRNVYFVAGAVSLDNGRFYFGGFRTSDGNIFRIWEYDPDTKTVKYKGHINTPGGSTTSSNNNGDMAFDAAGNLYVVRGWGNSTTVFSITKANLESANGSSTAIPASQGTTVTNTTSDVNGVAFDSDGKGYLGASSNVDRYNMPGWTGKASHTTSLTKSTDLASCSSPPTIVIEKEIIGGRAKPGDQFKLTLKQGTTTLGEATTSGNATGVQEQRIGPLPTVRNVALTFSEVGSGTTNLSDYASAYQCTVTHLDGTIQNLQQVNGTSGSITIPSTGEAVRCVFRNSPLVANVNIHKDVTDTSGQNPQPRQGWTVGAKSQATPGTVTKTPTADTQTTDVNGDASWNLKFNAYTSRATVKVSEQMQSGYEFASGECEITHLDGSKTDVTLNGPEEQNLTNIAPGDQVNCVYTNKESVGSVVWSKVDSADTSILLGGSKWTITGTEVPGGSAEITDCTATPCETGPFKDQDPEPGKFKLEGLAWGTYTVTETEPPAGYDGAASFTFTVDASTAGSTPITPVGNPFVNTKIPDATVTLGKEVLRVNAESPEPAEGWTVGASLATGSSAGSHITGPASKQTGDSGAADPWTISFDKTIDRAKVQVTETEQTGYDFDSGTCTITPLVGASYTVPIEGNPTKVLDEIKPGDTVDCTFTNKQKPGTVIWTKVDDQQPANPLDGSKWKITPQGSSTGFEFIDCVGGTCDGLDKDPVAGQFKLENLAWGTYTVTETEAPGGHALGTPVNSFTFTVNADNAGTVITADGNPFVNERIPGTVIWSKVDGKGKPLAGSVWQIEPTGGTAFEVVDCIGDDESTCADAVDKDHRPGHFKVEGLAWGDYTLSELTPPPGYKLVEIPEGDGDFTISANNLNHEFEVAFVNEQMDGPDLPLTGGIGRDHLYLAGALALLLSMAAYGTAKVRGRRNPHSA